MNHRAGSHRARNYRARNYHARNYRAGKVDAWVLRPVDREDEDPENRRYEPGLVLTTDGDFRQLDSELRGWGQRNFPQYHHTVGHEPVEMPVERRLLEALAAVLREHGSVELR